MKKTKIPTLLAVAIVVIGIIAGVILINRQQVFKLGATTPSAPQDVRITNITDSSYTVSWITANEATGFITWGEGDKDTGKTESDEIQEKGYTHSVTISGLKPSTGYNFKVNSNGSSYDNNGLNWQVKTGGTISTSAKSITVSGTVTSSSGTPVPNAIVYITMAGGQNMSTITSKNGSWVIPLSATRTKELNSYLTIDANNDILEIFVQSSPTENATAQAYVAAGNPVPTITLGQKNDFRSLENVSSGDTPEAALDLPTDTASKESKFVITDAVQVDGSEKVTLESIDNGEVITSTKPEFFGEGPKGVDITISVESEKIEGTAKVTSAGAWKWSPAQNLEPGIHKITLSWRDEQGILQSITKTFVVQAAEQGPAFEATPSATPASTATPKGTSTPTPQPTTSGEPTEAPTLPPEATEPPVPDSGTLTPTLVLSIMGIGLLIISATGIYFAYRKE